MPRLALFLLALFVAVAPAHAFCGFFAGKADASLFNEASQVVLARDGTRTVITMLNDYKGPLREFALVVPTPTVIKRGQVYIAERATFEKLDAYSSPRLAEYHDADPCLVLFPSMVSPPPPPAPPPPSVGEGGLPRGSRALGVTVEAAFTLEEYDIVSLSATESQGLEVWLRQNGYKIPPGASRALKPYIKQGMKFFVAKVNLKEQAKTGFTYLRPLQFAFESEKFMLPIRLGMVNAPPGKPQDLIVYALTRNGRVESSNYRTVKLPTNVDLPAFVKPKFKEVYRALFDHAAKLEDFRVVFTEYFWDMSWCDPCAADPLSGEELRKAGAFWVAGDRYRGGAQPALLTRLHVRYTPETFPEDLMFAQTQDRQNWQTRYVIHNPYGGSVAQCNARVSAMDCKPMCAERAAQIQQVQRANPQWLDPRYRNLSEQALMEDCRRVCTEAKQAAIDAAFTYYTMRLPARVAEEKQTLARITGWSLSQIDEMPGARATDENAGAQRLQLVPPRQEPLSGGRQPRRADALPAGVVTENR